MKITRFEDLQAWQQARVLANLVYDATDQGNFARDFKLRDQIRGAAGSVMHNCAEGFDAGFDNEFVVFLKYARRSASEIQSEIYLALDRNMLMNQLSSRFMTRQLKPKRSSMLSLHISEEASKEKSPPDSASSDYATKRLPDYLTGIIYVELC